MKTLLTLRPRNCKHRRVRILLALGLECIALWALTLSVLAYLASR